jgi:hypothetical protein
MLLDVSCLDPPSLKRQVPEAGGGGLLGVPGFELPAVKDVSLWWIISINQKISKGSFAGPSRNLVYFWTYTIFGVSLLVIHSFVSA